MLDNMYNLEVTRRWFTVKEILFLTFIVSLKKECNCSETSYWRRINTLYCAKVYNQSLEWHDCVHYDYNISLHQQTKKRLVCEYYAIFNQIKKYKIHSLKLNHDGMELQLGIRPYKG